MKKKKSEVSTIKTLGCIGMAMFVIGLFFSHWFFLIGCLLIWLAIFMGVDLAEKTGMAKLSELSREAMVVLCLTSTLGALNGCIRNGVLSLIITAVQCIVIVAVSIRALSLLSKLETKKK